MKKLLLLLILTCLAIGTWAQQITEQQAMDRALKYLNHNETAKARGLGLKQLNLKAAKVEPKSIYAFNMEGGGYVIASGDSRALPVLGYSDKGTIDWDHLPSNMREWLKSYDQAMASLGHRQDFKDGIAQRMQAKTRAKKSAVAPLIKTKWDQGEPYWNMTPSYKGAISYYQNELSYTGCVATAMAQVMNYYQWPKAACAAIPAYDLETEYEDKKTIWHIDGLPSATFDWDQMLDDYWVYNQADNRELTGTEAQQAAVATLMRYCGQAVRMIYTPEGSGAYSDIAPQALVKYFGYDGDARCVHRVKKSIEEWEDLIYDEVAEGRPVLYSGISDMGGHEFICDGYDGNGLFHFNWGWGGSNDGYFSLSVLDPYINSNVSNYSGIGFCVRQDACVNVRPASEGSQPQRVIPSAYLNIDNPVSIMEPDTARFSYYFVSLEDEMTHVDFALGTCDYDGTLTPLYKGNPTDNIAYNMVENHHLLQIDSTAFQPGDFEVLYPMVKFPDAIGDEWQLLGSKENFFYTGRSYDGTFFLLSSMQLYNLEVKKAEFKKGNGYIGVNSELVLTIKNHGNTEFTLPTYVLPCYFGDISPEEISWDKPYEWGDWIYSQPYLRAGEEAEVSFSIKPKDGGTIYLYICLYDNTYLGTVVIESDDIIGLYDDYVVNNSYIEMKDAYGVDYEVTSVAEDDLHPGHVVYHVNFADIPEVTVPDGKPLDDIYLYAGISDYQDGGNYTEKLLQKETYDYLCELPANAGDGSHQLSFDLDFDIRRGGWYYMISYFNVWLDEEKTKWLQSCSQFYNFVVYDNPAIRLEGDTILASGDPLNLELHLNSGYPYNPADYSGAEQAQYTLYDVADDGTLTERRSEKITLNFAQPDEYGLAVVDTMTVTGTLPDGNYLLRVSSDVSLLGTRDIHLAVGSTGINKVISGASENRYFDLQGRRLEGRPAKKGVYIRNNRKEVIK